MSTQVKSADWDYETVAASQTAQVLGEGSATTKAAGSQYLSHLIVVPATTGAGNVAIKDGADSAITVFVSGTLPSTQTFIIPLRMKNKTGSWQITTGSNVSVIAVGSFN